MRAAFLAFLLSALTGMAPAQEFVTAPSRLSDADFYRLVACAAPPGGSCRKPVVRWSDRDARDLSIAVVQVDPGYPEALDRKLRAALTRALREVDASGANVVLRAARAGEHPDVMVFFKDVGRNGRIMGTGLPWLDGHRMEGARMQMGWRADGTIRACAIAVGTDITDQEPPRVMLEELTQCLGLLTDIGGRYYESRSIFSETSGQATRLGAQDIMALRRHYP